MADPYGDAVDGYLTRNALGPKPLASQLNDSLTQAVDARPDFEAELRRASERTGVPLNAAQADPKTVNRDARVLSFDPTGMSLRAPTTAAFLAVPENAKIAHDDVPALEAIENIAKGIGERGAQVVGGLGRFAFTTADKPADKLNDLAESLGIPTVIEWGPQGIKARMRTPEERSMTGDPLSRALISKATNAKLGYAPGTTWEQVKADPVSKVIPFALEQGIVSLPDMVGVLASLPAYVAARTGEIGQDRAKNDKRPEATVEDLIKAAPAAVGSALLEKLGTHGILGIGEELAKPTAVGVIKAVGGAATKEGLTEAGQEVVEDLGATIGTETGVNPAQLADQVAAAAVGGLIFGGAVRSVTAPMQAVAENHAEKLATASDALRGSDALTKITEVAVASKLRERDPATFEKFVAQATAEGPVQSVFVDPRRIGELLASTAPEAQAEAVTLMQSLPGLQADVDKAMATGGDVEIPVSQFATYLAPTVLGQSLIPHLKTDPLGMSQMEADAFLQTHGEELKADVEKVVQAAEVKDEFTVSATRVQDAVLGQLTEANRYTPDVNQAYAELTGAFYATMARRAGVTPEAMYAEHQMKIAAAGVTEGSLTKEKLDQGGPAASALTGALNKSAEGSLRGLVDDSGTLHVWDAAEATHHDKAKELGIPYSVGQEGGRDNRVWVRLEDGMPMLEFAEGVKPPAAYLRSDKVLFDAGSNGIVTGREYGDLLGEPGDLTQEGEPLFHGTNADVDGALIPSERGALGPGVYLTPNDSVAKRYGDRVYTVLEPAGVFNGLGSRDSRVNPYETWREQVAKLVAASPEYGDEIAEVAAKMQPSDGYPFYRRVEQIAGSTEAAQQIFKDAGFTGLSGHVDGPEVVLFDAADAAELTQPLAQNAQAPRGSYNPNTNLITLLKNADLSTFLHESGHFYLETMARLAVDPNAPADVQEDMATVLKFMGHGDKTAAEWLATDLDQRREGHELFARGFEAYLLEGKSPSQELRGLFQRFRSWLLMIYQTVAGLRVELTDDVRGVFDRMLASQQQIERQGAARAFSPYYATKPEGATDQEWEAYQRQAGEAAGDAVDQLQTRSLRDMRWLSGARDKTIRRLQREASAKRKAIRAEVEAEVMAEPVNRARRYLTHGLLDGQEVEGPSKLSLPELRDMYPGKGQYPGTGVDYRALPTGKYGMVAEEGVHPEQVAELFGYSSGDELVRDLIKAEPYKEKIDGLTDQRMLERYGDLVDKDAVERAADEALHNDARLKFVATEAAMAQKAIGGKKINNDAARAFAAELVNRAKVRDLKPSRYVRAESRAAEAARKLFAAGDQVGFATEKRNQLINGYAAKATYDAQEGVAKALRYFDRLNRPAARKAIDPDYRDQIDALLERFDLSKNVSLKALDKRKSLVKWVEAVKENTGLEPIIPEELLNEANRKHYKELTVEELKGLTDSVRNIVHLGRLKNRLLTAKTMREFKAAVEALSDVVATNAFGKPFDALESNQLGDKVEKAARGFFTSPRKFDSLMRRLDGHNDNGLFWELMVRPKNAASDTEETMRNANNKALHAILTPLLADKFRQKVFIPAIGASLSLEGRLAVALNWGSELNRKRVMDGDNWTEGQVNAILATLEPRHFKFVQDMWDHTNSFRPQIEAMLKRQDGVLPTFREASPVQVTAADGSVIDLAGGYYHIEYDPDRSAKAAEFDLVKMVKQAVTGAGRNYARPGYRKATVDEVLGRPLKKTLSVGLQHLNDVIHDLSWSDYIIDAKRLLGNETLANAIRHHAGPEVLRSLKSAVEAMEIGDAVAQNSFEASVNYVRSGATIAGLGYNFMTSALQPFGILNGTRRIGAKWMGVGLNRFIGDAATMQNAVAWVHALSPMMAERATGSTLNRELYDITHQVSSGIRADMAKHVLGGKTGAKAEQFLGAIEGTFFYTIGKMQMVADVPTWIGQYEKSMADHGDEKKAIAQADQAVMDSQGSGRVGDLSAAQRGGPLLKLWTNFYSYMNVVYNQLAESVERTQLQGDVPRLMADAMLVLILPTIFATAMKGALRGDDWEELPEKMAHDLLSSFFGMFVGVRDLAGAAIDGNTTPAGMSFIKTTANFASQVKQMELDEAFWKSLNAEAGILFHYPSGQVQKTAMGIKALAEGTTRNPLAVVTGPPPSK